MSNTLTDDVPYSERQLQVDYPEDEYIRMQPLVQPPVLETSSSASPSRETRHRKDCRVCFQRLIGCRADYMTTALKASVLCPMLKNLGMTSDITKNELRDLLKVPGYADESGVIDFERFTIFAEDFKLMESLHIYKCSWILGEFERGPLGDFFGVLKEAEDAEFLSFYFTEAFNKLDMELTDESADSLERYANLHKGVKINFEQFLRVLCKEHGNYLQRTGQMVSSRGMAALDKNLRIGRLMAFVSAYTRSYRGTRKAAKLCRK